MAFDAKYNRPSSTAKVWYHMLSELFRILNQQTKKEGILPSATTGKNKLIAKSQSKMRPIISATYMRGIPAECDITMVIRPVAEEKWKRTYIPKNRDSEGARASGQIFRILFTV